MSIEVSVQNLITLTTIRMIVDAEFGD